MNETFLLQPMPFLIFCCSFFRRKLRACGIWTAVWCFWWACGAWPGVAGAMDYPALQAPGSAQLHLQGNRGSLENNVMSLTFEFRDGQLRPVRLTDKISRREINCDHGEFFRIDFDDAAPAVGSELKINEGPRSVNLPADPDAIRSGARFPGKTVTARLASTDGKLQVDWSLELRNGSNYIRQFVTLRALRKTRTVKTVALVALPSASGRVVGTVSGSPVVVGNFFFAYEHPNSRSEIVPDPAAGGPGKRIRCRLERNTLLKPNLPLTQSAVFGVVPPGQLRRGFLYYIERERAYSYRPFLHYNSWYDIAWSGRKMHEAECRDVIDHFGRELIRNRQVKMDSFVFDDGWDDNTTLWKFLQANFPDGFTPLTKQARRYDSAVGVWLSPWGGYGKAKEQRLEFGRKEGFETSRRGFSLAGPKYYNRFRQCCLDMIDTYQVNFFKFDGTDAELLAETEALFGLIEELRNHRPDLYVSITSGTWASPFWLLHGDNIWRGGHDMHYCGKGSRREQWINYRDVYTYRNVVQGGPLYPLNSLMLCGINNGQRGTGKDLSVFGEDFVHEVRSFFATGTNLQELYITPGRMTSAGWDVLAEGAKWSRANSDVLVDSHWLGGDPEKSEIYGWAAWSERMGILALRNPNDQPGKITIDIDAAFELPPGAARKYSLKSPWKADTHKPSFILEAGRKHSFSLPPFEVLVWEATPVR